MAIMFLFGQVAHCVSFASWQDDVHGREFIQWFDPSLNHPADEKSYGQNCAFTARNLYNGLDHFALAHFLGWFGKAVILRDFWACTILSVMFEVRSPTIGSSQNSVETPTTDFRLRKCR